MMRGRKILLDNVRYVIIQTGGFIGCRDLFIVKDDGAVYYAYNWDSEDIAPLRTLNAEHIGTLPDIPVFPQIPDPIEADGCDLMEYTVYDASLSQAIYKGEGEEREFENFVSPIIALWEKYLRVNQNINN